MTARPAKRPVTRKRATAKATATVAPGSTMRAPGAYPSPRVRLAETAALEPRRRRSIALGAFGAVLLTVVSLGAVAAFLLVRADESTDRTPAGAPRAVSPEALATAATSPDAPAYWAGPLPARTLELVTTDAGTFVRYLPLGVVAGDPRTTFTTVASYPLRDSYETAVRRRSEPGMASRELPGGGVAVWSRTQPSSVYLAYPQRAHLVEVYAEAPAEARRLALSGRIRPARP